MLSLLSQIAKFVEKCVGKCATKIVVEIDVKFTANGIADCKICCGNSGMC
jgi:hypothetical protein